MKKSVAKIIFYLVCLIVLLLFSAMFLNLRNLEGFTVSDNTNNNNDNNNNNNDNNNRNDNNNNNNDNNRNDNNNNDNNRNDNNNNNNNDNNRNDNNNNNKPECSLQTSRYLIIGSNSVNTYLKPPRSNGFRSDSFYTSESQKNVDTNELAHFATRDTNMLDYIGLNNSRTQVYFYLTSSLNTTGITKGIFCLAPFSGTKYPVIFASAFRSLGVIIKSTSYEITFVKDANGAVSTIISNSSERMPLLHSVCETIN